MSHTSDELNELLENLTILKGDDRNWGSVDGDDTHKREVLKGRLAIVNYTMDELVGSLVKCNSKSTTNAYDLMQEVSHCQPRVSTETDTLDSTPAVDSSSSSSTTKPIPTNPTLEELVDIVKQMDPYFRQPDTHQEDRVKAELEANLAKVEDNKKRITTLKEENTRDEHRQKRETEHLARYKEVVKQKIEERARSNIHQKAHDDEHSRISIDNQARATQQFIDTYIQRK